LNRGKVIEGAGTNGGVHVQAHETNSGLRLITFVEGEAKGSECTGGLNTHCTLT